MPKLIMWNLSRLKTPSRNMTGPLPDLYLRDLTRLVEECNGVYLSGIQVGDTRRWCIPNPQFKNFPIFYNPEIKERYDLIRNEGEGCLSFPSLFVQVPRYKWVEVVYKDAQWQDKVATFGSDNPASEDGLLAKAIQHECYHMDGVCLHERITDNKKRIKVLAYIMSQSIKQNKEKGVPNLVVDAPPELDPNTISVLQKCPNNDETEVSLQKPELG